MENNKEKEKLVCAECGSNDLMVTMVATWNIDEYGEIDPYSNDISDYSYEDNEGEFCNECGDQTRIITLKKYLAKNRDKQIDEILND